MIGTAINSLPGKRFGMSARIAVFGFRSWSYPALARLLNQFGEECQLETRWPLQSRIQRVPPSKRWLSQHRRAGGLKSACAGR
jgi:hypothetical protein